MCQNRVKGQILEEKPHSSIDGNISPVCVPMSFSFSKQLTPPLYPGIWQLNINQI